jgi:hyperosmotically inducible protein
VNNFSQKSKRASGEMIMEKRRIFAFLFICAIGLFLANGCRTAKNTGVAIKEGTTEAAQETGEQAEKAGKKIEDGSITAAIKMKFANDETVSASKIDVDTSHGNVTLNGTVSSREEENKAVELARTVDGVKSVHSNLVVQ